MSKRKDPQIPQVNFPLESAIPKAPSGVLGSFIQRKLHEYVEPAREGTPKGEPVGLSRQKYHAALLSGLTSIDLKKIAREVRVSYPLLRKWRTEDQFFNAGYDAAVEFASEAGAFDETAKISLRLVAGFTVGISDIFNGPEDIVKKIHEKKLFGFDDGALYGQMVLSIIDDRHAEHFSALTDSLTKLKPNEEPAPLTFVLAGDYVGWTYCLDRIGRMMNNKSDKRAQADFARRQRMEQSYLNIIIMSALAARPAHPSMQGLALNVSVIQQELFKA